MNSRETRRQYRAGKQREKLEALLRLMRTYIAEDPKARHLGDETEEYDMKFLIREVRYYYDHYPDASRWSLWQWFTCLVANEYGNDAATVLDAGKYGLEAQGYRIRGIVWGVNPDKVQFVEEFC